MKFILIFFMIAPFQLMAQISVEWSKINRDSSYSNTLSETLQDSSGNIYSVGTERHLQLFESNPYVIKYNSLGGLEFKWSLDNLNLNSTETIGGASLDSIGNIYIGSNINTFPVDTGRFIKIEGATGQEIFNIPFNDASIQDVLVSHSFVYVLIGSPLHSIVKFDLAGNIIWSQPLQNNYTPLKLFNWTQCLGVLGEEYITSTDSYIEIERYTWNGTYLDTIIINPGPSLETLTDSKIDMFNRLWLVGESFDISGNDINSFISVLDTNGIFKDTVISSFQQTHHTRVDVNEEGSGFISVYSSPPTKYSIFKFSSNLQFLNEVDSVFPDSNPILSNDINAEIKDKVITVNRKRRMGNNGDYEISCFDSTGLLIWNFDYALDSISREIPFKIITSQNSVYIIGLLSENNSTIYGTNVLKLNLSTGLEEVFNNPINVIFPNPNAFGILNFSEQIINAEIKIFNIAGNTIINIDNFTGSKIYLPQLNNGLFLVQIQTSSSIIVQKLIIINN